MFAHIRLREVEIHLNDRPPNVVGTLVHDTGVGVLCAHFEVFPLCLMGSIMYWSVCVCVFALHLEQDRWQTLRLIGMAPPPPPLPTPFDISSAHTCAVSLTSPL